jgi:hypothetical protein
MPVDFAKTYTNYKRPETTDFFIGNVMEWQTVDIVCLVVAGFSGDIVNTATVLSSNKIKDNNGVSWFNRGFDVGDSVSIAATIDTGGVISNLSVVGTVSAINNDEMEFSSAVFTSLMPFPAIPGYGSTTTGVLMNCSQFSMVVYKKPKECEVTVGHVENADAVGGNTASVIDGSNVVRKSVYDISLLPVSGNAALVAHDIQSGMAIHSANVQYVTSIFFLHVYKVSITFMMHGAFDDSSNYDDPSNPIRPDYFAGIQCLTDVYRLKFKYTQNNPNVFTVNDIETFPVSGNTGGFNENFNGGADPLTIESVVYKDILGNVVDGLDYWNYTNVEVVVDDIPNLSNLNTKFTFGFMYLPQDEADYKNNQRPFHYNCYMNTGGFDPTDVWTVGTAIPSPLYGWQTDLKAVDFTNITATIVSGKLHLNFRVEPTALMKQFFEDKAADNRKFLLYINVGDYSKATNVADWVSKIIDSGDMIRTPVTVGPYNPMYIQYLEHDLEDGDTGVNYVDGFVEDDGVFQILLLKSVLATWSLKKFEYVIEAIRTSDGEIFPIETIELDLTPFPSDINGTQLINILSSRNFKYANGDLKNEVRFERFPAWDFVGSSYAYKAHFGLKLRWEDWIFRNDVPADFVDIAELQNGRNNDWLHYFETAGWTLKASFYTTILQENGEELRYKNTRDISSLKGYDTNNDIAKFWLFKRVADNSVLNIGLDPETGKTLGTILDGELTEVQVQYNILDATLWPALFADSYGTICMEVWRGSGEIEHRQLSTIRPSESDNPLKPLPGESFLNWSLPAPNVLILKCHVDPSFLQNAVKFRFSSRVESIPRLRDGKEMEDDTPKLMEDGGVKNLD